MLWLTLLLTTALAQDGGDAGTSCQGEAATFEPVRSGGLEATPAIAPTIVPGATVRPKAVPLPDGGFPDSGGFFIDQDGDGWESFEDCDDRNASVNPGMIDIPGDGVDNDCSGYDACYRNSDGDSYGSAVITQGAGSLACLASEGEARQSGDCNDTNALVYPGATEVCDGLDNNCNGSTDENVTITWYTDADDDGYGTGTAQASCSIPATGAASSGDCNDQNPTVYPGAQEICDGLDNNCNNSTDENVQITWYTDADDDGYGTGTAQASCSVPATGATASGDCNDQNPSVHPNAPEACNDVDDDCDGTADEGLATATYHRDNDNDGYGSATVTLTDCAQPSGYVTSSTDCNDNSASVHPGAAETCNNVDDDCDGTTDEGVRTTYYDDDDGDGYGDPNDTTLACSQPTGFVATATDCNDTSAAIHPGAAEVCNGISDDCDAQVDEGLPTTAYYTDADGDTYGAPGTAVQSCGPVPGTSTNANDCNDSNAAIRPGATETCNTLDDDCDGTTDEGVTNTYYDDDDGDGFGD
ncbi:MAG: putative metal-binding motif-containing protein, partial [Ilumatobacteraceae bacterium]